MIRAHTLEGVVVDPIEGAHPGIVVIEGGWIAAVERREAGPSEPLIFPGFVDLQVYAPEVVRGQGVTGYLLATRSLRPSDDPLCLGLHLEGPFLNPAAAGAIPVDELTPVDLGAVDEWTGSGGLVRLVTLAPELPGREQVPGDALPTDDLGRVHLEVDEAREDERLAGAALPPLDRGNPPALDDDDALVGSLDRVNDNSL